MHEHNVLASHSVPATVAGFDFQFQRALLDLIDANNGDVIGIETLDDVAVISADGTKTLEQDKFTTSESGTVYGDKTHNLLNTLSTWLAAALMGEIDCDTTKFYLVTNVKCSTGLVQDISDCEVDEAAHKIVSRIRGLDGKSQEFQTLIRLLDEPGAENLLSTVCIHTKLLESQDDIALKVQEALPVESAYAASRQHIFKTLLGWMHDSAFAAWQRRSPFLVTKQHYINELGAIKDRLRRESKREKPPSELPVTKAELDGLSDQMFVRQIQLVSDDNDESYDARADYLRCIAEKSRLSEEGEILKQDWLDFDDGLKDRWEKIFRHKKRLRPPERSERDVGYDIMSTTLNGQDEVKLAGSSITYQYLSRGSYHRLSDALKVGWHPRFEDLLTESSHA